MKQGSFFIIQLLITTFLLSVILSPTISATSQNYTLFTEVDANNYFTFNATRINSTNIPRNAANHYVYRDYGVNYFTNYSIRLDARVTAKDSGSIGCVGILAAFGNTLGDLATVGSEQLLAFYISGATGEPVKLYVSDWQTGVEKYTASTNALSVGTTYYLTLNRSGTTMTAYIYTDSARTTLLETVTRTGVATTPWRYFYAAQSCQYDDNSDMSFYAENLDIYESLNVTTQAATNINATNATLNADLSSLGNATSALCRFQYGTTASYGTNTTNTTLTYPGSYSKDITGLTPGSFYHSRAAVDNTTHLVNGSDMVFLTKPNPPSNFNFTLQSSTSALIRWDNGTGVNTTLLVYNTDHQPTFITDGTIAYNSTTNSTTFTMGNAAMYYFSLWSYTNWSEGGVAYYQFSSIYPANYTAGGLMINCFDASNNTNLTFNVTVTNQDGTQAYTLNNCSNTISINASLCPQGLVTIMISSSNYSTAIYTVNIQSEMLYLLNVYLNHVNKTYLYRLIINNEKGSGEKDVYAEIKQQINGSNFEIISNITTDSSGYVYIWLDAEELYIITLSKTGFQTNSDQFTPSTSVFEYTFIIEYIDIVIPPDYIEYEQIVFTATRSGTTITIQYQDKLSQTINTTIYVYSENATTKTRSLISTTLNTSTNTITLYVTVNQYNSHIIILFYNHTTFHSMSRTLTIMGVTVPISSINKIDTLLPLIIGSNPFGWGNFLMFLFLLAGCYYADERDVGKILVLLGGMFLFINVWLGFNTTLLTVAGGALPLLFIAVGLLVIWGDSNKKF